MNEKKHTYQSTVGLPSLKVVLGEVPNPDGDSRRPFRPFPFAAEKPDVDVRTTNVKKLIGFMQEAK